MKILPCPQHEPNEKYGPRIEIIDDYGLRAMVCRQCGFAVTYWRVHNIPSEDDLISEWNRVAVALRLYDAAYDLLDQNVFNPPDQ